MLQLLLFFWLTFIHPFYVSVTEIEYNQKTQTVQVSVRLFFDDFETALNKRYKTKINILKPANRKQVDALIAGYVGERLKVAANDKSLGLKYLGYEIQEDAAWCYFETEVVDGVQRLNIQNNLLFEQHESQINMIHATVKGKRKSAKLDNPNSRVVFSF